MTVPYPSSSSAKNLPLASAVPGDYLSLRLGAEEYGIEILKVQEIRSHEPTTRVAGAPAGVVGVLNLRGDIVPVIDLRERFGMAVGFGAETVTVVVNIAGKTVGLVVDSVSDVVPIAAAEIKAAPQFGGAANSDHIIGIGCPRQGEHHRMLILLNIARLVADGGLAPDPRAFH
ncbi:MAG: chemotaxis protein CheW [Pseudomonadota bacterium]|nr:chemotaxis protein CheW [Pseudomonadota bacterium]